MAILEKKTLKRLVIWQNTWPHYARSVYYICFSLWYNICLTSFHFSFCTSSIAALFQVHVRLHGYFSGARTWFWCTAEAGGRRGKSRLNRYEVAICPCAFILNSLFASLQRVFASTFVGRKCVIKERFSKKYRHPLLDAKLTLKRLNAVSLSNQHCSF